MIKLRHNANRDDEILEANFGKTDSFQRIPSIVQILMALVSHS